MPTKRIQANDFASPAIDAIPYGMVIIDGQRVISANRATANLLWTLERGGPPERCHELFACQAPGGPCESGCLCTLAGTSGAALPEIRIDTHPGSAVSALWVTAAPMREGPQVVLHLRPGDARDRRRRTDPHWLEGPEVRISALGRTWVSSREGPLGGRWLQQRPGRLLKYPRVPAQPRRPRRGDRRGAVARRRARRDRQRPSFHPWPARQARAEPAEGRRVLVRRHGAGRVRAQPPPRPDRCGRVRARGPRRPGRRRPRRARTRDRALRARPGALPGRSRRGRAVRRMGL